MVYGSNLALKYEPESGFSVTAQALRKWCVPELVLAVTDLADEERLLFHVIRQATPGKAKVLLTHIQRGGNSAL